jgi:hypothetical protein
MKYWGNDQEEAIVIFNTSESTEEKHKVYVTTIQPAFKKLVENIYFTYNFNKMLPDFDQIEHELVTHLYEKIDRFDVTKGKKSYSFFGTISKNWLIQKSNSKKRMSFLDGNNKDTVIQDISLSTAEKEEIQKELKEFLSHLPLFLNENKFKKDLNGEDKLVLGIISDILENYHMFDIYNKKQLYLYIREATDLPSRKITKTINKIKNRYIEAKKELMDVR